MEELQADDLDYQYEEALTLLGQIVAEQHRFERFEALAGTWVRGIGNGLSS